MIELISSLFKEGDYIKIFFSNSSKSMEGYILKILADTIALKTADGLIWGIKGADINSFEKQKLPKSQESAEISTLLPASSIQNGEVANGVQKSPANDSKNVAGKNLENSSTDVDGVIDDGVATAKSDKGNDLTAERGGIDVTKLKPGDVIPPDQLDIILAKGNKRGVSNLPKEPKKKLTTIGRDFRDLRKLVADEHAKENLNVVPALGEIKWVNPPSEDYGFIKDPKIPNDIYFKLSQIVGKSIPSSGVPVVYSVYESPYGFNAYTVHTPMSIQAMLDMADDFMNKGEYKHAQNLVEQILKEYPNNFSADDFKRKLRKSFDNKNPKKYSDYYTKAREYQLKEKDYSKAIECYLKAIENRRKVESAIKDLGMLYGFLYKSEKDDKYRNEAIQLMKQYSGELPNTISTWYYLENLYYSVKAFEAFLEVVDKLLECDEIWKDTLRRSILLCKKSSALVQLGDIEKASEIIDEALNIDPLNTSALKLKTLIIEAPTENIKDIMAKEFDSLSIGGIGGVSKFIHDTIENYTEYAGVPPKIIESGDFQKTTLEAVQKIEETAGKARPRERAKYLLTEGKLFTIIEPENLQGLRKVMARYCNAMALNHISNNSSHDVTRFYYNEAFALEETYEGNAQQIRLYLLTHCCSNNGELLKMNGEKISVETALGRVVALGYDSRRWESILSMLLYNREISAQITSKLYADVKFRDLSLKALDGFGIKGLPASITEDDFKAAWNNARELRIREYKQTTTQIETLGVCSNLEDACSGLPSLRSLEKIWMTRLDTNRIHEVIDNIQPAIDAYLKSSGYRNKEANKNNALAQMKKLIDEIKDEPTKLSYDAMLPFLEKVNSLIVNSFAEIKKRSTPKITIKLLSSKTVVNENNEVDIQLSVSTDKDSSPIKEVSVDIAQTDRVKTIRGGERDNNPIEGGDSHIFKLKIKVDRDIIAKRATALDVICKYKDGDDEKEKSSLQSLSLYSEEEYTPTDNPYAPLAEGGPVPVDSNMFFGREEFISNIVDAIIKSPSKQIIIYGQKRCGKSSVLVRLKKKLTETGTAFCVFFSLGDIIKNLTETTFYHKILSSIVDELEMGKWEGMYINVPPFVIPSISEFKAEDEDNPLNTFMKYMVKFKLSCKHTEGWEDKRLVVMIDEFTYLYTQIRKGEVSSSIMKQWKAITQNERTQFSVVLVGQDVVPTFKKEDYARNAFGVIQDIRLTYLNEGAARDLIENPILDPDGKSRYIENAVSKIIEYTSRNPYYIQIFCSRLVDFMNDNRLISVTEADVENVARSFIEGSDALAEEKFDNLIRAGETEDYQEYDEKIVLEVLRQIAVHSKNIGKCNRQDICVLDDKEEEDKIFRHLTDREVLERSGENNYKIQVKLFQEWLLKH